LDEKMGVKQCRKRQKKKHLKTIKDYDQGDKGKTQDNVTKKKNGIVQNL